MLNGRTQQHPWFCYQQGVRKCKYGNDIFLFPERKLNKRLLSLEPDSNYIILLLNVKVCEDGCLFYFHIKSNDWI